MNNIVNINPQEYGLERNEAEQIQSVFIPMIEKMQEIELEYNEIVKLEPTVENCKKAKELRLRIVKIRTGTAEIHKKAKSYYLNGGRFVDGFKNTVTFALQDKEDNLEKLEKYFENLEKERIAKLQEERIKLISLYIEDYQHLDLGSMKDDVWNAYYNTKKKEFEDKIKAEKEAEQERIKKEQEEKKEQEKIKKENERLKAEAEAKEKELQKEREENQRKQAEIEAKARAEAEAKEKELQKEREENQRKQAEIEAKARAEAEAKEIAEKEAKAREEQLKKENYINYRKSLGYTEENKQEYLEQNNGTEIIIYKKIGSFKI